MTTATKFTLVRIFMIPLFMVCMYISETNDIMRYVSLAVFGIASLTDLVDGHIARKYNQVTDLGKFLDPLADKVLVLAAMAMFCEWGMFPAWALMIVLVREFAISGLRMVASGKGTVIAAGWSGKVKTAVTMAGLCIMLLLRANLCVDLLGGELIRVINWVVIAAIAATTLYSGVEYFAQNGKVLVDNQ
ncbi:MAG: CDP-diacylglycerol--glycerol-3-phosphate 3-phosphatidyltransferase [Ruminococcaceae bacterium]|nr:CDP-diacylglycerol--glycerol-3-phosphate 3-phosphatidyltransferase [Oscillospiraceae bacterium]